MPSNPRIPYHHGGFDSTSRRQGHFHPYSFGVIEQYSAPAQNPCREEEATEDSNRRADLLKLSTSFHVAFLLITKTIAYNGLRVFGSCLFSFIRRLLNIQYGENLLWTFEFTIFLFSVSSASGLVFYFNVDYIFISTTLIVYFICFSTGYWFRQSTKGQSLSFVECLWKSGVTSIQLQSKVG